MISAARADNTFINLEGIASVFNGSLSTEIPFTAVIQYDTSLLHFSPYGVSYAAGYPAINATPNPEIGSITVTTALGSQTAIFGGIDVDVYTSGGTPATIFGPGTPDQYNYSAVFYSSDYAFSLTSLSPSDSPFSIGSPYWLPTATDSQLTTTTGLNVPLQANLQNWGVTNVGMQVNSFSITSSPSAVPVPAATWLFGSGLLSLVGVTRRRKLRG